MTPSCVEDTEIGEAFPVPKKDGCVAQLQGTDHVVYSMLLLGRQRSPFPKESII